MLVTLRRLLRPAAALALVCAASGCGLLDTSSDTRAPLVTLTRPTRAEGLATTAAGDLLVSLQITPRGDDNGVSEVGVLLNNARVATAAVVGTPVKNTAGFFVYTYTARVDLRGLRDGDYRLEAVAFDRFGARGTAEPVRLRVLNGTAAPLARLTEPLDGASVSGDVRVVVVPNANAFVTRVDFLVDGLTAAVDSVAPFEWVWPTRRDGLGEHVLQGRAYDGGVAALTNAARVTVTDTTSGGGGIDPPPPPPPTGTFDPNCTLAGCRRFAATAPAPLAAPLAADAAGNVYGITIAPSVVSWSPAGAVRWTRALAAASRLAPLVGTDGSVYVADEGGRVTAITAAGAEAWMYDAGAAVTGGLALTPAGQVAFGDARGRLHVVGIVSGIASAGFPATVSSAAIATPVAVLRSGDIAVTSSDGLVTLMGSNGLKRWTSAENFGALVFGPVLSDVATGSGGGIPANALATVLVVNSGGRLVALSGGTGAVVASTLLDQAPRAAPIVGADGTVFALTAASLSAYSGDLAGLPLSRLWSFAAPSASSPSLSGDTAGRLFLPTATDVTVLNATTGDVVTRYAAGASTSAALVAARGTYYGATGTSVTGLYTGATGPGLGRWPMLGRNARHTFRADDAQ